jgi:hypothetical protein
LSQNSGFSLKSNYEIEYYNGTILIFIHDVNYNIDKIRVAIDIIEQLSIKIKSNNTDEMAILSTIVEEINNEYKDLTYNKELLIDSIKESYKNILLSLDDIHINSLEAYLSSIYINNISKKNVITCDICNQYKANNLKAISAHKRACKKKK